MASDSCKKRSRKTTPQRDNSWPATASASSSGSRSSSAAAPSKDHLPPDIAGRTRGRLRPGRANPGRGARGADKTRGRPVKLVVRAQRPRPANSVRTAAKSSAPKRPRAIPSQRASATSPGMRPVIWHKSVTNRAP